MMKSNIFLLTIIFGILAIACCSSNENSGQTLAISNECLKKIQQAEYMEDIFKSDTIHLSIPDSFIISMVTDFEFTADGKPIICDYRTRRVLLFDSHGKFLRQIGREGSGPGEYQSPRFVAVNKRNQIIIADGSKFKISIFDESGNFLNSFSIKHNIHELDISPDNEIIIYDPSLSRLSGENPTIFIYNENGKLLRKFGKSSVAYQKLKAIPFEGVGPYLVCTGEYLFETDYPDYHIRKYDMNGNLVKEFGAEPREWRSVLETNYHKLSPEKQATMSSMRMIDDYFEKEFSKCTFTYCLKYFESGIVCTMTMNGYNDFARGFSFSFYDIDGNLLKEGLTFRNFPELSSYPLKYFFPGAPDNLSLIAFAKNSASGNQEIDLIVMRLKCEKKKIIHSGNRA